MVFTLTNVKYPIHVELGFPYQRPAAMPLLHHLIPIWNSGVMSYTPLTRLTNTDNPSGDHRLTYSLAKAQALSTDQLLALLAIPASSR